MEVPKRKIRDEAPITGEELRRTPKKAKLHANRVVPMDFFYDAVQKPDLFLQQTVEPSETESSNACNSEDKSPAPVKRFGWYSEALLRDCYADVLLEINKINKLRNQSDETGWQLVEVRGSAGIGKSAFLAFLMAQLKRSGLESFGLFHAPKTDDVSRGLNHVLCSVWINGELKMDAKRYGSYDTLNNLESLIPKLDAIFMDGCSTTISLEKFSSVVYVAASPIVATRNLRKAVGNNYLALHMPPWSIDETIAAGDFLGVARDVVEGNYAHMNGIVRYMFNKDMASQKVSEAAKMVNPQMLIDLVGTNETNKEKEKTMVHSLVLWKPAKKEGKYDYRKDVSFELVSRFAEKKVAEKLSKVVSAELAYARQRLSPLTGAEGFAGALFEAFAIRKIQLGGDFLLRSLETEGKTAPLKILPTSEPDSPIVLTKNVLSTATTPIDELLLPAGGEGGPPWKPRFVWPETTNFPTFDAYYAHEDGTMYPLQITLASKDGTLFHHLNNNGAYQTKKYLDQVAEHTALNSCGSSTANGEASSGDKKYKAIFVVPAGMSLKRKKQDFKGNITQGKTVLHDKKAAAKLIEAAFEQWVLELDD